jgi:RHS repeat-associated protein
VDSYAVTYDGLDRAGKVEEKTAGTIKHTTSFTYNANGDPLTRKHDGASASFNWDLRNLLASVTNAESASDPSPKVTKYNYTGRGQLFQETKANGNVVSHSYWADWLPRTTEEKKPDGTLVASHVMKYSANGDRISDVASVQNADNHAAYLNTTTTYTYDPRDRIAQVTKTPTGGTASVESYIHDANDNVVSQTVKGVATSYAYDRNRLQSATSAGATAAYNYDPFGRLDTVTSAGQVIEDYGYDGFDRTAEHRKLVAGALTSTKYAYDPLDRTLSRTEKAGTPSAKTTDFAYLGLTDQLLDERVAGTLTKSYQYGPGGQRLSQTTVAAGGAKTDGFYGYNPHTDVETVTDSAGDTRSTYGYTAYGSNDTSGFTGIDKPDPAAPDKPADNVYRFNAKRWDAVTGTYDMGFRDYNPGLNRFLTRDSYTGALADLNLGTDPYTGNRYAFAGGNPVSMVEVDGHDLCDLRALGCVDPDWDDANGSAVTEFPEATRTTTADGQNSINGVPISNAAPDADALAAQVDKWAPRFKEANNLPTDRPLDRANTALLIGDICYHDHDFCGEKFRKESALLYDKMLLTDDPGILLGTAITPNGGLGRAAKAATRLEFGLGTKIKKQMASRGWTKESIDDLLNSPSRTITTRDTRWRPDGTRLDDPATAFINREGAYVVRNDLSGDIVQISNRLDPNWKSPW